MFKLGKSEFKIKNADLHAAFTTWDDEEIEFVWCIDIEMEEGKLILDDEEDEGEGNFEDDYEDIVSPSLYHENGFRIDDVHSWKELEGVILEWEDRENDNGEDAGYIYTFEHDAITEGKIEFLKRNGNKYLVRWSGMVEDEIPFEFEGELNFSGILVDSASISNQEELKSAMMEFIDMEEFKCVSESSYDKDDGEQHNTWRCVPKDANWEVMNNIISNSDIKVTEEKVNELLNKLKVQFPEEIVSFYGMYNGGEPSKYIFTDKDGDEYIIQSFIPILSNTKKDIVQLTQDFRKDRVIEKWFIPLAYEAGGHIFGVSVRSKDYGKIFYWNTDYDYYSEKFEDHVFLLEDSFSVFLENLSDD